MSVRRYYNRISLALYAAWLVFLAVEPFYRRTRFGPTIREAFTTWQGGALLGVALPLGLYLVLLSIGVSAAWVFRLLTGRR